MAIISGAPTGAAERMAALVYGDAQSRRGLGFNAQLAALAELNRKREMLRRSLAERQADRERQKAAAAAEGGDAGAWGAGAGAATALVLSPFTGGASLAALPALAGAGGAIGGAIDGPQGAYQGGQLARGFSSLQEVWPWELNDNYEPMKATPPSGGNAGAGTAGPPDKKPPAGPGGKNGKKDPWGY